MSPVALSQIPHYSDAWIAETLKPDRARQLFRFAQVAIALARKPGRLEYDEAESNRIVFDLFDRFGRGELNDPDVLKPVDQAQHFVPLRPLLEEMKRQTNAHAAEIFVDRRELILTRYALRFYLERCGLEGAPRVLREWFDELAQVPDVIGLQTHRQAIASRTTGTVRRARGRKPIKRQAVADRMREEIALGATTRNQLAGMMEKKWRPNIASAATRHEKRGRTYWITS